MEPCTHTRRLFVSAKCSDMCFIRFPNGHKTDGYVIPGLGIGVGDYVEMEICIDCKTVIDFPEADDILAVQAEMSEGSLLSTETCLNLPRSP